MFSIMKKKIPPLNFPNKKVRRPVDIHTGYSNLPEMKQIVKRQQVD